MWNRTHMPNTPLVFQNRNLFKLFSHRSLLCQSFSLWSIACKLTFNWGELRDITFYCLGSKLYEEAMTYWTYSLTSVPVDQVASVKSEGGCRDWVEWPNRSKRSALIPVPKQNVIESWWISILIKLYAVVVQLELDLFQCLDELRKQIKQNVYIYTYQ